MNSSSTALSALTRILEDIGPVAVAISGGVDSVTLAHIAFATSDASEMFHAVSGAVPREATERVQTHAKNSGWDISVVDAGESEDERYLANPLNRCFYCKTNLYKFISSNTTRPIVSGTNTDDLNDYRPGLEAAAEYGVRHPYVEAGLDKSNVRDLARYLKLEDLAELPANPCLSSRIETGLRVTPKRLEIVDIVERHLHNQMGLATVRCRIRSHGVVIEVEAERMNEVRDTQAHSIKKILSTLGIDAAVTFEPYRQGAAFVDQVQS